MKLKDSVLFQLWHIWT